MEPTHNSVPKHVAIILDGNRRFAKKLMLKPWKGHEWGEEKVEKTLDWLHEFGVAEVTFYAFSYENLNRPKKEFDYLMNIFREAFDRLKQDKRLDEYDIRLTFIGRIHLFPQHIQELMRDLMEKTKDHKEFLVNFAMVYGGREEIIDATKKIAEQVKKGALDIHQINEETFSKELYTRDEPDLIIRTGGMKRTSNFLPYQSIYSEWIFLDKMWPEFEKDDLEMCIKEYQQRQRRFGR